MLTVAKQVTLARLELAPQLSSSDCGLADPGREYLVYQPNSEAVIVDLSEAAGRFQAVWLDPVMGAGTKGVAMQSGRKVSWNPIGSGNAVLHFNAASVE